jgi:nitroreductase
MPSETTNAGVLATIMQRRSVRHFQDAPVDRKLILEAIKAASWAPSGLNNQPWRFALVWDNDLKEKLAGLTRYSATLRAAAVLIPVFLDKESSYDFTKDCQAVGASMQNLLLSVCELGLGAVWVGEILKNKDQVLKILDLPDRLDLMAVVAIGHPAHHNQSSHRRPLEELIVFER